MGPRKAAEMFRARTPSAAGYAVKLFGSLAATGKGHLTDSAIASALAPVPVSIEWKPDDVLPAHPNGMVFAALDAGGAVIASWQVYSVGGGDLADSEGTFEKSPDVYELTNFSQIVEWAEQNGKTVADYVFEREGPGLADHLARVWEAMKDAIRRGLDSEGALPGCLRLPRKASSYYSKSGNSAEILQKLNMLFAYALAVSEENASGGTIVTAPTCGSCGVLPAVLFLLKKSYGFSDQKIYRALATAGIVGNVVKRNASISGAEVGCQGEIGVACAMAAAAAAKLWGATASQIEYAAEMGLEHHLGLTCDPIEGLVQIPCIERNAMAAARAFECAAFALNSDGRHRISFDQVVETMEATGRDLQSGYRETARGGLAVEWRNARKTCPGPDGSCHEKNIH